MTERGTGGGYTLSPDGNAPGKISPLTPQTPQSGKRDSGYLTDFSPASGTSTGRHFTFDSPFPPEDEGDEADEELSALGATGGYMGGSRMSRTSSVTPEIDVFTSPPPMEQISGRRSRGRPRSRSSMTPDIDVFLPTPEVNEEEEEEELAQVDFEDKCFSVVEPSLPGHMQPPNFVSRPIPIPHCMMRGIGGPPRLPGEVQGQMRYPSPASCPLSTSSTVHHSAGSFGSPRNTFKYFGHFGTLSRSIATQTPSPHSVIIQDLIQGGVESQTLARGSAHSRLRHHSEGDFSEETHTTFRLSPLPDLVPVTRDRSVSLPNVPALSQPEIEVGRELRRISDEFHFEYIRGSMSSRNRGGPRQHPSSYPGESSLGIWQSLRWLLHSSSMTVGTSGRRVASSLPRRPESTPPRHLPPMEDEFPGHEDQT